MNIYNIYDFILNKQVYFIRRFIDGFNNLAFMVTANSIFIIVMKL